MREPRGARRKRETRARLMRAAQQLMAEKGVEGVAINEITEAADVGFGSFYNHFPSKEAIHLAVVEEVLESVGAALERASERLEDPAEVVAACTRYVLLRVRQEPVWGRFLLRTSFNDLSFTRGLGPGLIRSLVNGVEARRFKVDDPPMTYVAVAGIILAAIQAQLQRGRLDVPKDVGIRSLGLEGQDMPERTAAVLLKLLGLPPEEAAAVARRPLPQFEAPAA